MGLDMYLLKRNKKKEEVEVELGYWRKANAIHGWFVRNCQDGNDDCGLYEVSKEQLTELRDLCNRILNPLGDDVKTPAPAFIAETIQERELPTVSGFFFGGTDYDEGYYEDLRDTVAIIDNVLAKVDFEKETIFYGSSW